MSDVEALSVPPTRGVPAIVGAPSAGAFAGALSGPATVAVGVFVSRLRGGPQVQIAPETAQSRPAGSAIVSSPSPSGSTVISNRSFRPSTRVPRVTRPPVVSNASSRRLRKLIAMGSLNATRKRNALSPSCAAGTPSNDAVSGGPSGSSSVFRIVPVAVVSWSLAKEALLSTSVNVSPSSSTSSSMIGTDTVFSVSSRANVSVPLVSV